MATLKKRIVPHLWYDKEAKEAAKFYCSVFPNSKILRTSHYGEGAPGPKGSVMTVEFELDGQRHTALNGGPTFKLTEAFSLMVHCKTQKEVDTYWEKLLEGGEESQCGWLKDRYGLSWQIVPTVMDEMMRDKDPKKVARVVQAFLPMKKFDIAALERAAA